MDIKLTTQLPPGFRFHPSDEELIVYYLRNKVDSNPVPALIIADIDLYMYNPWELPVKALFGTDEWYFFSPRDRKYPNGARPNRAAASGYWKATGTDKLIVRTDTASSCGRPERIGVKKGLVFYVGKPPRGSKTDWIMNEYRLQDSMEKWGGSCIQKGSSMRLDDWVLCRVRQRGSNSRNVWDYPNGSTGSPNTYNMMMKSEMHNFVMDTNQSLLGWPISNSIRENSQVDILSMVSSLTYEDLNQESDLFSPNLKRKLPEDRLQDDCTYMPAPLKKNGREDIQILSMTSNGSYNIKPADNSPKEDTNASSQFYSLDDEWNFFSENYQALMGFQ
ncbi:unnamed protein product [Rhodiola kirilowii]